MRHAHGCEQDGHALSGWASLLLGLFHRTGHLKVMREDSLVKLPEQWAWLQTQRIYEALPRFTEAIERLSLAARAVKREHEVTAEALTKWICRDKRLELADHLLVAAQGEIRLDPLLENGEVPLVEPRLFHLGEQADLKVSQRHASPEPKGFAKLGSGKRGIARRERIVTHLGESSEAKKVEFLGVEA